MTFCTREQERSIKTLIKRFFRRTPNGDLKNLESSISTELGGKDYKLSDFLTEDITKLLEKFGVDLSEMEDRTPSFKSNVIEEIASTEIDDLFHGLTLAKLYFDNYVNGLMVKNYFIGYGEAFLNNDEDLTKNFLRLKGELFNKIQQFLIDNKVIDLKSPKDLYDDNFHITDYHHYESIMQYIADYFFSGNNFATIKSYSGKTVPNIDVNMDTDSAIYEAYFNMILLSNFDSVLKKDYSHLVKVNTLYYNHLTSTPLNDTYTRVFEPESNMYWSNETHMEEGVESLNVKLVRMIADSIPAYDKSNNKTLYHLQLNDFYLLSSIIANFELLHGHTLKNMDGFEDFKYFSSDVPGRFEWYINTVKQVLDGQLTNDLMFDTFENYSNIIYSLYNYIHDPELNILEKEKNSDISLMAILGQVINNTFGASYTVNHTTKGLTIQQLYSEDFNSTGINNTVYSKMVANSHAKKFYDLQYKTTADKLNKVFEGIDPSALAKDALSKNAHFSGKLRRYIHEILGIKLSPKSFRVAMESMEKTPGAKGIFTVQDLKEKLKDMIEGMQDDFTSDKFLDSLTALTGTRFDSTVGELVENTINKSLFKALSKGYLIDTPIKGVMNIKTHSGESIPSYKIPNLTYKDTELFSQQYDYENDESNPRIYRSLLITDTPAIVGTSTKLELINNKKNKAAGDFTPMESLLGDVNQEFFQNIIKNKKFNVIIGAYSDKSTILQKIINANFVINGKPIVENSIEDILETVRKQSQYYYHDTVETVFNAYKELFNIVGINPGTDLSIDNFEASVEAINNILSKHNISDLVVQAQAPHIKITAELHYTRYADGTFLNNLLLDNYRIFSSEDLFKEFVKRQEQSFLRNYSMYNAGVGKKIFLDNDVDDYLKAINIKKSDYPGENLKEVTLKNGELNPLLRKWLWINGLFRNEYLYLSAKGEYMHPIKGFPRRSGEINDDYWNSYLKESSARLSVMSKRNVAFTSTFEAPIRDSVYGVPTKINLAAIDDFQTSPYSITGDKKYKVKNGEIEGGQDAHDGSTWIDYTYSLMIDNSYPAKGYSGTKKQFGTLVTEGGVVIKKDAESVLTNRKILNSTNSSIRAYNLKKKMLSIPITDVELNYNVKLPESHFFNDRGKLYRIGEIQLFNDGNGVSLYTINYLKEGDNWILQDPIKYNINNLFDLWQAFGGQYSTDSKGNFNESSNELLYKVMTANTELKNRLIHVLSNRSALKAGATNLNPSTSFTDNKPFAYATFSSRFMGPQLDASHSADESEIKEITQIISALAQGGFTSEIAREAYEDIQSIIKETANSYINNVHNIPDYLYKSVTDTFIKSIIESKGNNLAKVLVGNLKKDDIKIPFSNQNFYNAFVKELITKMNTDFISRNYPGLGAVLVPSEGMIQLYDITLPDGRTVAVTQESLIKEALENHDEAAFQQRYGLPSTNNYQIFQSYLNDVLPNQGITVDKVEIGDTIEWNGKTYYLNTPEQYYNFKEEYENSEIQQSSNQLSNIIRPFFISKDTEFNKFIDEENKTFLLPIADDSSGLKPHKLPHVTVIPYALGKYIDSKEGAWSRVKNLINSTNFNVIPKEEFLKIEKEKNKPRVMYDSNGNIVNAENLNITPKIEEVSYVNLLENYKDLLPKDQKYIKQTVRGTLKVNEDLYNLNLNGNSFQTEQSYQKEQQVLLDESKDYVNSINVFSTQNNQIRDTEVVLIIKPLAMELGKVAEVEKFIAENADVIDKEETIVDSYRITQHYKQFKDESFFSDLFEYYTGKKVTVYRLRVNEASISDLRRQIGHSSNFISDETTLRYRLVGEKFFDIKDKFGVIDNGIHFSDSKSEGLREVNVWFGTPPLETANKKAKEVHEMLWTTLKSIDRSVTFSGGTLDGTEISSKPTDLDYRLAVDQSQIDFIVNEILTKIPGSFVDKVGIDEATGNSYTKLEFEFEGGKADIAVVPKEGYVGRVSNNHISVLMSDLWKEKVRIAKDEAYKKYDEASKKFGKTSEEAQKYKQEYENVKEKFRKQVNEWFGTSKISRSLEEVYELAEIGNKEFNDFLTIIEESFGEEFIRVVRAPLKSEKSLLLKAKNKYRGRVYKATDVVRGTIVLDENIQEDSLNYIFRVLKEKFPQFRVEDYFKSPKLGYKGINIDILTNDDGVIELQINIPEMIYFKEYKEDAIKILGPELFERLETKYNKLGGLGHIIYDLIKLSKLNGNTRIQERLEILSEQYYTKPNLGIVRELIGIVEKNFKTKQEKDLSKQYSSIIQLVSSPELEGFYKELSNILGVELSEYIPHITLNGVDPTTVRTPIKEGVSELFEQNPELANSVYETLRFGKESNNIEILTSNYTRQSVQNDVDSLYLFTDNAQRTSRPSANEENVDKNSWYYKKYKSQTNKPIHFGSTSNPTSAVIRGLNNAYPISTMSAYGTNWTDSNFELFKQTIDDEIAQIKKDLSKFSKVKIGDFRIGQGGRFAKLPQQHQQYLDNKLLEIGIDNTGNKPKIINSPITPQQKQQAQQLYSQYLDTIGVTDIGYHHSESDLESFTTFPEGYFPKELKKKGTHYKEADDIVFFVRKPLTEEFMSKRKFTGTWGLKIPNTLQFNAGEKVGEGVHPGIDEGIRNAVDGNYDAVDFGRIRDNKTWSEVVAITNPKNAVKLGSKQDIEGFKNFINRQNKIYKVYNKPRDLKPTLHTFNINGEKRNVFDLNGVKLRYYLESGNSEKYNNILNNLSEYVTKRYFGTPLTLDLLTNNHKKMLNAFLNLWAQRDLSLMEHGYLTQDIDENTNFDTYFANDNLTEHTIEDVLEYYQNYGQTISDVKFRPAELIVSDIFKTKFGRDNISSYDLKKQKSNYFLEKLLKDFTPDKTKADIKINTTDLNHPVYIRFTDDLKRYNENLNLREVVEGERSVITRFNDQGERVYNLVNPRYVSTIMEDGKEIILIKKGTKYIDGGKVTGYHKTPNLEKIISDTIKSFKGSITSLIPLMKPNNTMKTFTYEQVDGKSTITGSEDYDFNTLINKQFNKFYNTNLELNENSLHMEALKREALGNIAQSAYASWLKSHDIIAARIPAQSMQSFMPMRVVEYSDDSKNDAFVSISQIWLQGSDFDIDKAYLLGYSFDNRGKYQAWSNLSNFSTKEQIDALDLLPMPTKNTLKIGSEGIDIGNFHLEIINSFDENSNLNSLSPEAIKSFNKLIRYINKNGVEEVTSSLNHPVVTIDFIVEAINRHNTDLTGISRSNSLKNGVVSKINRVISSPSNQLLANSPVSIDDWHQAVDIVRQNKETYIREDVVDIYNNSEELKKLGTIQQYSRYANLTSQKYIGKDFTFGSKTDITLFKEFMKAELDADNEIIFSPYDIISYYIQQYNASVGKADVGIAANGVKAFFGLTDYYNHFYKEEINNLSNDEIKQSGKVFNKSFAFYDSANNLKKFDINTIADLQISKNVKDRIEGLLGKPLQYLNNNAALNLSGFLSGATDNAKELLMAKVNATPDLASMHIYLTILGLEPVDVVEIMTSQVVSDILKRRESNLYVSEYDTSIEDVFEDLEKNYKDNPILENNLEVFKDLYYSSKELSALSGLFGVNQKRKANTWEVYKYLSRLERVFDSANEKFLSKIDLAEYSSETEMTLMGRAVKINPLLVDQARYMKTVLTNVRDIKVSHTDYDGTTREVTVNLMTDGLDFRYYINDPNYRQIVKDYYGLIKHTFNVFDVLDSVPHFAEMVNSLVLVHNRLSNSSKKYNFVTNTLKDIINKGDELVSDFNKSYIDSQVINKGIYFYDTKVIEEWLKTGASDVNFRIKDLMRLAKVSDYEIFISNEAKNIIMDKGTSPTVRNVNINDSSNPLLTLDSAHGIAQFKKTFEELILPIVQNRLQSEFTDYLKVESVLTPFSTRGSAIVSTFPLQELNNPVFIKQFQKLLNTFNFLDTDSKLKGLFTNSVGKELKIRDLFFIYNLITNNERYGNKRLTPILENYMQESDSLGYKYIKYWSDHEHGEGFALDKSDPNWRESFEDSVLFHIANTEGRVSIKRDGKFSSHSINNPHFTLISDIALTREQETYRRNLYDTLRVIKEKGIIINLKC